MTNKSNVMIKKIYLVLLLILLSLSASAQNNLGVQTKDHTIANKSIDLDKAIKLKENNKKEQIILIEFGKSYHPNDLIRVTEFQTYFELTVEHPSVDGFTSGAEGYTLNKKTGKSEMIWHEEPMKLPKLEYKIENTNDE